MASFDDIIKSHPKVLVDFHATWCGPCKALAPILVDVKNQMGENLKLVKIDVDKNQPLANKLNVRGVPTMIFYKDGELAWRQSGVIPANELLKKLT